MKAMQKFHLKQTYHEISFYAYDIENVKKLEREDISRVYIPECSEVNYGFKDCSFKNDTRNCINCRKPHFQEILIDGWYVGDKHGWLTDDCYIATLQTGIRVPVPKEVYDAWKEGFTNEAWYSSDTIYELT